MFDDGDAKLEFRKRFDGVDARLDAVDARFDAVDTRFAAVDARFDQLTIDLDAREERIINAFKVHTEDMRDMVLKAIEVCVARVESVERTVDGMRQDWQVKWTP